MGRRRLAQTVGSRSRMFPPVFGRRYHGSRVMGCFNNIELISDSPWREFIQPEEIKEWCATVPRQAIDRSLMADNERQDGNGTDQQRWKDTGAHGVD